MGQKAHPANSLLCRAERNTFSENGTNVHFLVEHKKHNIEQNLSRKTLTTIFISDVLNNFVKISCYI